MRVASERRARLEAERQLRLAKEEAEQANRAKDRFLAVLSHELRTPLAAISYASQLMQKVAVVPSAYGEIMPTLRRNVALEARLIDDLLDISAITSGKLTLESRPVDMHAVLSSAVALSAEQRSEHPVQLHYLPGQDPVWVTGDEHRLQQVVSNVLRNAIKFSEVGAVVRLAGAASNGQFVATCTDEGIGIEAASLDRIFVPFEQAGEEITRRFGGLGLGLSIARTSTVAHGGTLSALSDGPGRGATFTLRLPLSTAATIEA